MDDGHRPIGSDAAPAHPSTPPQRRWARVLDGGRAWGSLDIWPSRYGFRKYRLVVFPPGIGPTERRYLRLARSWPTWGAALWLTLAVGLSSSGAGWAALVYPTAAFLLSGAITFALARGEYANTRTLSAALLAGYDDPEALARFARLERLALALVAADAMHGRGELTNVEHEAIWWMAYETLGQEERTDV